MGVRSAGCLLQLLLGSVRFSESQIVGDSPVEQVRVLRDDRYVVPDSTEGEFAEVVAT